MTRAMIIGNAGGGKSTIASVVAARHGLPVFSIDDLMWRPGWRRTPETAFQAGHEALLKKEKWLIDGFGSWASVLRRMDEADAVIFVDHPLRVHLWWALKRQAQSLFLGRESGPAGCRMWPVTFRLFRMILWLHREMRPKLLAELDARRASVRIIHIRSPKALVEFAANPV